MTRLDGRLALVTGASSGIGEACVRRLAAAGADVALWARREDRLEELAAQLEAEHRVTATVAVVDVRDRDRVERAAGGLIAGRGAPDVLVNNAGLASGLTPIQEGHYEDWDRMIDTNVKGLLNVTRSVLPSMVERGTGHVINVGSTAGHWVYPNGNVYNATKYAVKALTEAINLDVAGTSIRASSVDPGFVRTEFSDVRFHGDTEKASAVYDGFEPLTADDVADVVMFMATRPPHVNVFDVILVPTAQRNPFVVDRES